MATTDLYFTVDGDFHLNEDGTLYSASDNNNEVFVSQLYRRLLSRSEDWTDQNVIAANLNDFFGLKINQNLLDIIRDRIYQTLILDGLLDPSEFQINTLVVNTSNIIISVNILKNTDENNLSEPIRLSLNTSQNRVEAAPLYYDETLIFSSLED